MHEITKIDIDINHIIRDKSTSDGSQIKYFYNNLWYKIDNHGGEAESEVLASLILKCSNLPDTEFVDYKQILINNQLGCVSKDFRNDIESEDFITLYRLYQNVYGRDLASVTSKMDYDDAITYVIDFVRDITELDIRSYLANIFYLDEIILNTDRHFNNYGIIMSDDNYRPAPIFDNGKSLLTGCIYDRAKNDISIVIKNVYSKSFSPVFHLNSLFLNQYRTLEIDFNELQDRLDDYPHSLQKDVLLYQLGRVQ